MWTIDKQFNFCYGHRVWSQELKAEYCEKGDASCKCKHLHGHEATVHVFLEAPELERGMVTDFKHLGWLKDFLDTYLDHKFIIDIHDPLFDRLVGNKLMQIDRIYSGIHAVRGVCVGEMYTGSVFDETKLALPPSPTDRELMEGFFIVDFVPTSENLSQWLFKLVQAKMKPLGVKVSRVDWFETPKSRSTYSE